MRTVESYFFLSVHPRARKNAHLQTDTRGGRRSDSGRSRGERSETQEFARWPIPWVADPALVAEVTGRPWDLPAPWAQCEEGCRQRPQAWQTFVTGGNKHDVHFIHVTWGGIFQAISRRSR